MLRTHQSLIVRRNPPRAVRRTLKRLSRGDRLIRGSKGLLHKSNDSVSFNLTPVEELVYVTQTICKRHSLNSDELIMLPDQEVFNFTLPAKQHELGISYVTRFPYTVPLPQQMKTKQMEQLDMLQLGHSNYSKFYIGIAEYYCAMDDEKPYYKSKNRISFWLWSGQQENYPLGMPVVFIKKTDWPKLYRKINGRLKDQKKLEPPILPKQMLSDLYNNSIGFLKKGAEAFRKYDIPFKRGIMLAGPAGNGKTLAARWLRQLCIINGWQTKIVNLSDYKNATMRGGVERLFNPFPNKKGMVFFDDLDVLLTDRKTGNMEVSNFLSGLDGITVKEGIVYIFTTNEFEGLDKAAIRPNRIDLFLKINKPTDELRKEFILKKFPEDVLSQIDINDLVKETKEHSFAELEEIRRLFCIDIIEKNEVDMPRTMNLYSVHRQEFPNFPSMGFRTGDDSEPEVYYPYNDDFDGLSGF